MSSNEQETRQEREPNAVEASTAACCQPCTPGKAFAFKRTAEQCAETTEEQTIASQCDFGTASPGGCCGERSGK